MHELRLEQMKNVWNCDQERKGTLQTGHPTLQQVLIIVFQLYCHQKGQLWFLFCQFSGAEDASLLNLPAARQLLNLTVRPEETANEIDWISVAIQGFQQKHPVTGRTATLNIQDSMGLQTLIIR